MSYDSGRQAGTLVAARVEPGDFSLHDPLPWWAYEDVSMRLDDWVKRTVVFVGLETAGRFIPFGTAFIVGVKRNPGQFNFLVTAKHVVDQISGDSIAVRVNRKAGGSDVVRMEKSTAIFSSSPSDDLALLPIGWGADVYDFKVYNATRDQRASIIDQCDGIGLGDETAAIGLYTSHHGLAKNIPVARMGHISSIPDEPIMASSGYVSGYIVEMVSIGGLSGSPVFLNVPPVRIKDGAIAHGRNIIPIGILLGHHVIETREDQIAVPRFQEPQADELRPQRNPPFESSTGLCVVVPFEKVFDILEQKELQSAMDEAEKKQPAPGRFVADASTPNADDEKEFNRVLKRMLDTPPRPKRADDA
jgi:hypothetical protein